jgi:LacI family transcriptional regulator
MRKVARAETCSRSTRLAVALLIETSNRYTRELLHGIRSYMRDRGNWAVHLTEYGRGDVPPPWLKKWRGDGIIARIENQVVESAVRAVRVPVVNVSAAGLASDWPTVISDSVGVARLAFEHLLERGFQHFAYCGDGRFVWSSKHGANFVKHVEQAGYRCAQFELAPEDFADWEGEQDKLARWLESLPKPVGIMACYDICGQQVLDVCRRIGVPVPDEVALIGHHNDELLCELCDPPLSSVIPNGRRAGYEAASLLDRLMNGERLSTRQFHIAPLGVATRLSTDVVALDDRLLVAAIRFIRENACQGIGVDDVLQAVPMSRTLLERKFQRSLRRAPYEEIVRVRLRRAKELLTQTELPAYEIAERTAFSTPEYLSAAFKKQTGMSPMRYRNHFFSPK